MVSRDGKHFYWVLLSFVQAGDLKWRVCHSYIMCWGNFILQDSFKPGIIWIVIYLDFACFAWPLQVQKLKSFQLTQWEFQPTIDVLFLYCSKSLDCYLIVCTVYQTNTLCVKPWILPVKQSTGRRGICNNCFVGFKRNTCSSVYNLIKA